METLPTRIRELSASTHGEMLPVNFNKVFKMEQLFLSDSQRMQDRITTLS